MRSLALIAAVLLVGCHRPHADQPNPGADGDAQAATANKTITDIQAAEDASQGPAPEITPIVHHDAKSAAKQAGTEETTPTDDTTNAPSATENQAQ